MSVTEMLQVLRRGWLWVLAGLVLGGLVALAAFLATPKAYQSQTTLYVTATDSGNAAALSQGASYVQSQIRSYPMLVTAPTVLERVAADTGVAASDLADSVTAEVPADSSLLTITATADDPQRAVAIAGSLGRHSGEQIQKLETRPGAASPIRITAVAAPVAPSAPAGPSLKTYLPLGLVLGTLLGFVGVAVRHVASRR